LPPPDFYDAAADTDISSTADFRSSPVFAAMLMLPSVYRFDGQMLYQISRRRAPDSR